jgi:hypothetical protein
MHSKENLCSWLGLRDEGIGKRVVESLVGNQTQAAGIVLAVVSVYGALGRR